MSVRVEIYVYIHTYIHTYIHNDAHYSTFFISKIKKIGGANSSSGNSGVMGSISNFFSGLNLGGQGQSHTHHHAHGPISAQPSPSSYTPDVTSGKSDTMDR